MSPLWIVKKMQSARDFFECLIFSADCVEIIHATNRDYEVQNDRVVKKIAFYSNIKCTLAGSVKDYTKVSSYYSDEERPTGRLSVWAFFIYKFFLKKFSWFRRSRNFHSCYGVKGRCFTLFQWVRKEVNSYGAIFFRKAVEDKKAV